jgi:hypothetical protein
LANTLLTNSIITAEALDVLENTNDVLIHMHAEYSDDFEFGGAVLGQTLRIRKPPRYFGRLGQATQVEAITESEVPLTLSFQRGVDTQVSSQQLTLDIDNYRKRVLSPQIARLSNLIDQDCCNLAQGLNEFVGVPGTTPSTLTTYGLAKVKLDNMAAPKEDRCMFLNPIADFTLMDNLKGLFNATKAIASQYNSGTMVQSNTIGSDWYMDQNIFVQTVGALGASTPTTNGVPVSGASQIITQAWAAAAVLNAGDKISFVSVTTPVNGINPQSFQSTGQTMHFVVTATSTADGAGAMTIPIAPAIIGPGSQLQNVTNLPATGTPVFVWDTPAASFAAIAGKQSPQNLAVHHDWGTIAMVDMPLPGGTDKAYRAASRKSGKSIRVIRDFVATTDQWLQRIDVLYGTAILRQELGVVVAG